MVQTYPHKLPGLELELFDQIVNSLVFGSQQVTINKLLRGDGVWCFAAVGFSESGRPSFLC